MESDNPGFGGCEDVNPARILTHLRNSILEQHFTASKNLSNESTCLILKNQLEEYNHILGDDSKPNSVDYFSKQIGDLLQNKKLPSKRNQLRFSDVNFVDIIKGNLEKSEHCNIANNLPCKSHEIQSNQLKLLQKTSSNVNSGQTSTFKPPVLNNFNKPFNNVRTERTDVPKIQNRAPIISSNPLPRPNLNNSRPNQNAAKPNHDEQADPKSFSFKTARSELMVQNVKKYGNAYHNMPQEKNPVVKRSLGTARTVQSKFISPILNNAEPADVEMDDDTVQDERLKHIDPKMVELIMSEIIDSSAPIAWDDIAGLEFAKSAIQEAVVWPLLRPDIFTGLRRPPRGILLFGPPGTGKTLIGKCIASQCSATFFSISASSLTSKWLGDGEKMVRALFAVARCHQPAVVFIDEIDSLLTQRSDTEHEATRRIKTEFLVQLDGAAIGDDDRILLIGATNRPQELDEAARRRLVKRLYIPLPDLKARMQIISRLMRTERNSLTEDDIHDVAEMADGFSGADMRSLCGEAALGPIRTLPISQITNIQSSQVRAVDVDDFKKALTRVRPSVSSNDLEHYTIWDKTYGSGSL